MSGLRYLPLGDSYTIGQSVSESARWPNQLVAKLDAAGTTSQIVANPGVTGYTTEDLIRKELPLVKKFKPQFVTVQIGVNDYVQGMSASSFQKNLEYIVTQVQSQLTNKRALLLVTIPDYGKTPTGARYGDPAESEAAIKKFNQIIQTVAAAHSISVADIFPVSQNVSTDPSLIADDGLHPSGIQYAQWTTIIYNTIIHNDVIK